MSRIMNKNNKNKIHLLKHSMIYFLIKENAPYLFVFFSSFIANYKMFVFDYVFFFIENGISFGCYFFHFVYLDLSMDSEMCKMREKQNKTNDSGT